MSNDIKLTHNLTVIDMLKNIDSYRDYSGNYVEQLNNMTKRISYYIRLIEEGKITKNK